MYHSLHTLYYTTPQTLSSNTRGESSSHRFTKSLFNDLKVHKQQLAMEIGKSQLDIYLEEASVDLSYQNFNDLNVLQWSKENCERHKDMPRVIYSLHSCKIETA
ncbi:hypothetical protein RYX36_010379 [Vicia faba]